MFSFILALPKIISSARAVLTDDEKEVGVALVDIGGGTTDVAIYYDGTIVHTAVIPFGGDVVTSDIKQLFSLVEKAAEKLKIEFGSALADVVKENQVIKVPGINGRPPKNISQRNLANIIKARMEEIIEAIFFQIDLAGYKETAGKSS